MRCIRCNRPLNEAAFTTESKGGPLAWGPTCARIVGLQRHKAKARVRLFSPAAAAPDPDQIPLPLEMAA